MAEIIHTDDYHGLDVLSQSRLKLLWDDAQLFHELYVGKSRRPSPPTPSMQFGIDVENFLFSSGVDVALVPDSVLQVDKNGKKSKAGQAYKEWFAAQAEGCTVMRQQEYRDFLEPLESIKANIDACPRVKSLIAGGEKKVKILWTYLGAQLKSELDILHDNCIVDIKTAADVDPEGFSRQCANYGYHIQAAAYQLAVEQLTGKLLPFVFVAIANRPSYRVEAYTLSEKFMAAGRERFEEMIIYYQQCVERDEWHSETWGRLNEIDPPAWYEKQMEAWAI